MKNDNFHSVVRFIKWVDGTLNRMAKILIVKPMEQRKTHYFDKYGKEMSQSDYEKERFYLILFYGLLALLILFLVKNSIRGFFLD